MNNCIPKLFRPIVFIFVVAFFVYIISNVSDRYMNTDYENIQDEVFTIRKSVEDLRNGFRFAETYRRQMQLDIQTLAELIPKLSIATDYLKSQFENHNVKGSTDRMTEIQHYIKNEIKEYDADKIARTDFALESAGGKVITTGKTVSYIIYDNSLSWIMALIINSMCGSKENARAILQPTVHPGECWAFRGDNGEVIIRLLGNVHVTGVTLEHIPPALSPSGDILSAPKQYSVKGLDSLDDIRGFNFGTFLYNKSDGSVQYLPVKNTSKRPFHFIKIHFLNNWGNPVYTCVYRVRIHGRLAGEEKHSMVSGDTGQ